MKTNKIHIVLSVATVALLMQIGGGALASSDGALTEYERNLKLYNDGFISRAELNESRNKYQAEYERNLKLYNDGFISRAELNESRNKYQAEYERNLKLYNDGFISRAELDEYEKAYMSTNSDQTPTNQDKDVSDDK